MCGRYVIYNQLTQELMEMMGVRFPANYNAAPTQMLPVILNKSNGDPELILARWGLLPRWANDTKIKPFFNARADNLVGNKVFWESRDRHCIVPMSGFYEWSEHDKQPYYIYSPDSEKISVAGLWRQWTNGDDVLDTFCVITTTPHPTLRDIHHRSPVILNNDECEQWLASDYQSGEGLLREYGGSLAKYPVSKVVNNARNNLSQNIEGIQL